MLQLVNVGQKSLGDYATIATRGLMDEIRRLAEPLAGHPVRSSEDVVRIVTDAVSPGQRVRVTLVRQGKRLQIPIRLTERPASP